MPDQARLPLIPQIAVGSRVRLPEDAGWLIRHVRGQTGTVVKMIEPADDLGTSGSCKWTKSMWRSNVFSANTSSY